MYILDKSLFSKRLKEKGYKSVLSLAKKLNIHRNTINYYLSGHEVLPKTLSKVLDALDLKPVEAFLSKNISKDSPQAKIADLIDNLHQRFPDVSLVLFGSRARGEGGKYSDFDIGAFKKGGLSHDLFREMFLVKNELEEKLPFFVDLVDFSKADLDFLRNISKGWVFLTGRQSDWIELQRRVMQ